MAERLFNRDNAFAQTTPNTLVAEEGSGTVQFSGTIDTIQITTTITTGQTSEFYTGLIPVVACIHKDTDGDMIADHLDTDADGDGCPDALEGGGSFTNVDIRNDTLIGGVDANGVPIIATASGQTVGDGQDAGTQDPDCSTYCYGNDNDMDGICNDADLDDDNDGILDCDESISHESGDVLTLNTSTATGTITDNINLGGTVNFTFTSAASDFLLAQSKTDGTSIFFSDAPGGVDNPGPIYAYEFPTADIVSFQNKGDYNLSFSSPLKDPIINFFSIGSSSGGIEIQYEFFDGSGNPLSFTILEESVAERLFNRDNAFAQTTPNTLVAEEGSGTVQFSGTIDTIQITTTITTGQTSEFYTGLIPVVACIHKDTDGDMIADHLDTDADGDGCPDALEGGGSFTNTNIRNDTLIGGVDANGVPIIATASGQTVGDGQDAGTQDPDCSTYCYGNDNDMDGICNNADLDDDNDGILDCDESISHESGDVLTLNTSTATGTITDNINLGGTVNFTFTSAASDFLLAQSKTDGTSIFFSDAPGGVDNPGPIYAYEFPTADIVSFQNKGDYNLSFSSPLKDPIINFFSIGSSSGGIEIQYEFFDGSGNPLSFTILEESVAERLFNRDNAFAQTTPNTLVAEEGSGTVQFSGAIDTIQITTTITTGQTSEFYTGLIPVVACIHKDTDGDMIADHLDTDADGDGCPDAIEGGGSFTNVDIQNDTLTGGVDADGVPIVATASGQIVGDSQDAGTQDPDCSTYCYDNDMDGICNDVDLDDDNDGILDCDESISHESGDVLTLNTSMITGTITDNINLGGTVNFTFTSAASDISLDQSKTDESSISFSDAPAAVDNPGPIYAYEFPTADIISIQSKGDYNLSFSSPLQDPIINFYSIGSASGGIEIQYEFFDGSGNPLSFTILEESVAERLFNLDNAFAQTTPNTLVGEEGSGTIQFSGAIDTIQMTTTITTGQTSEFYTGLIPVVACIHKDTDGDMIADHLDTDADGDGCPDAIEGGGSFTNADIQNDTLTGGVDANGVPIVATASGQTVGTSADDTIQNDVCRTLAENDINQTPQGVNVDGNFLTNDTDPTGDTQTVQSATGLDAAGNPINIPVDGTPTSVYDVNGLLAGTIAVNSDGSYTFNPEPTFTGEVPVDYVVVDANGATDTASLAIEVMPSNDQAQNDSPVASDDTNTTEMDTDVSGNVISSNDTDPEGDALTVSAALADTDGDGMADDALTVGTATPIYGTDESGNVVLAGTMTLNSDGTYTFDPEPTFTGEVPVDYTVSDGNGGTDDATLTITVELDNGNNTYANDDASTGEQGNSQTGNVVTNDNDPEGNPQTVTGGTTADGTPIVPGTPITLPSGGTLTLNTDGSYSYTPDSDFVGTELVAYEVCDNQTPAACEMATLYLTTLEATNTTVAENDISQTPQDVNVDGNLLTNDTDPTGDTQTVQSATGLDAAGNPINIPVDGTPTSIYDVNGLLAGTIAVNSDGSYTFDPEPTFTGEVPVDYVVVDANGATDTASLAIEVMPSNDPTQNDSPVANDDTNTTEMDTDVSGNVISPNDTDPEGDALTISAGLADTDGDGMADDALTVGTATPIYGTDDDGNVVLAGSMTLNSDGTYTFDPEPTFTGEVPVDYTISDSNGGTDDATLTITIEPDNGNDTYANDDASTGEQGNPQTGNVVTNDNDPESDPQTVSSGTTADGTPIVPGTPVTLPSGGTLTLNPDGSYTYTPDPNFVGTEVVEYEVCDDQTPAACEMATLYLTTLPINTIASTDDFNNTPFETPVSADVSTNDIDEEGDNQTFTLDGANGGMNPTDGSVTLNSDGSYTFTPANGFSGETEFQYSVCDDGTPALCDTATVYIEVLEPISVTSAQVIANPDANTVEEGQTGTGNVLSNDLDPDGLLPAVTTPLTNQTVAGVDEDGNPVANAGTLTLNTDGTYTFVPTPGFTGTVTQPYTICDPAIPAIDCDDTELIIDVLPNDGNSTFANDDAVMTDAGVAVDGDVSTNDTDSENDTQTISSYMYDTDGDGAADAAGTVGTATQVGGTNDQGVYVANAGDLILNADGTYTFEPAVGFAGNVVIPYTTCDDVTPIPACEEATLIITILDVKRDYGDAPVLYPAAWHRKMTDANADDILDGTTDVWLGSKTSFEASQQNSLLADGDTNDDAITFGTALGDFPDEIVPSASYKVAIRVNSTGPDVVHYGLWIDWNKDGTYDNFYPGSQVTASPATDTVTIIAPATFVAGDEVNIRLRADDEALSPTDYEGGKSNGEVEDYQSKPIVLPVELSGFKARANGCDIDLTWVTETEKDFEHFELQWSGDGQDFRTVDIIQATGGEFTQVYQYKDRKTTSFNYYRLKMVDFDGSFEYSKIVHASPDCEDTHEVIIYPNPVSRVNGILNIKFYSKRAEAQLQITDMLGRVVKRLTLDVESDFTNTVQIDISDLPVGNYTMMILGDRTSKMLIIQE